MSLLTWVWTCPAVMKRRDRPRLCLRPRHAAGRPRRLPAADRAPFSTADWMTCDALAEGPPHQLAPVPERRRASPLIRAKTPSRRPASSGCRGRSPGRIPSAHRTRITRCDLQRLLHSRQGDTSTRERPRRLRKNAPKADHPRFRQPSSIDQISEIAGPPDVPNRAPRPRPSRRETAALTNPQP